MSAPPGSEPSAVIQANRPPIPVLSSDARDVETVAHPANFPHDALVEVFRWLRQDAMFLPVVAFDQVTGEKEGRARTLVAPPLSITGVCRSWREAALNSPELWASIPLLLENFAALSLGNPGQVSYHLERTSGNYPLKLIIGSRGQLIGPGVKTEFPTIPRRFDLLQKLAHRVVELTLAFDQKEAFADELFNPQHNFPILQRVWLQGISDYSGPTIHAAGFWRSPCLSAVTWAVSTMGYAPPLNTRPWLNLTELIIHEQWQVVLQVESVRAFLSAATSLVRFEVQVCECLDDNDPSMDHTSGSMPTAHTKSMTAIRHEQLQHLCLTYHGLLLEDTPALFRDLELPNLHTFIFGADYAANLDPTAVVTWVGSGCHTLQHLECTVDLINMADLIQALTEMPLLEVLKCVGSMVGCYYDSHRAISLFSNPSFYPYTDDLFLRNLGPADAYDAALGTTVTPSHQVRTIVIRPSTGVPCPILRELHITHGYFSGAAIEAFVEAKLYGGASRDTSKSWRMCRRGPLRRITVEDLVTVESVYETRNLIRRLMDEHGVTVAVKSGLYPSCYSERWSV